MPLISLSSDKLVAMLGSPNDWYVRKVRRILADRRDPEMIFPLRRLVMETPDEHLALEALWALYVSGGLSDEFAGRLLEHRSADVRWWTVRLLGDEERVSPPLAERLVQLAAADPSVAVRNQLACTAKRLPTRQSLPIVAALLARSEDAVDPMLPLLLWWAVERNAVAARDEILAMVTNPEMWKLPLVHETILPRLMRRSAAEATEPGYLACAKLLAAAPEADRSNMLAALDQGLGDRSTARGGSEGTLFVSQAVVSSENAGRRDTKKIQAIPPQLQRLIDQCWQDDSVDLALIRLAARLGRPAAQSRAIALAVDERTLAAIRVEAIRLLGEVGGPTCVRPLVELLGDSRLQAIQMAALDALQQFDDDEIGTVLLEKYPAMEPASRAKPPACC